MRKNGLIIIIGVLAACTACARAEPSPHLDAVADRLQPAASAGDLGPVLEGAASAKLVLLGEASHGTSEFYTWRAAITRALIERHGFSFVVIEGDWTGAAEVNRYIKGAGPDETAPQLLKRAFDRWPLWMWANRETAALVDWLKTHNAGAAPAAQVGFYGMDVYDHWNAMERVVAFVRRHSPRLLKTVTEGYACLGAYGEDAWRYTRALAAGGASCASAVGEIPALLERSRRKFERADPLGFIDALGSAAAVVGAEAYYRASGHGGAEGWNSRVQHMKATVRWLHDRYGEEARGIVWAHNTHVGNARATQMVRFGQVNIGQLARERWGEEDVFSIGFGTFRGAVLAGRRWGAEMETMIVPPALPGSWEFVLNGLTDGPAFLLFDDDARREPVFTQPIGHRAIGVVYNPEDEAGNYVPTRLGMRYDAFIFIPVTSALDPLK